MRSDAELRSGWRTAFERDDIPPHRTVEAIAAYLAAEQRVGRVSGQASPMMSASMLVATCYHHALVQYIFGETGRGMSPARHARALAHELWLGLEP